MAWPKGKSRKQEDARDGNDHDEHSQQNYELESSEVEISPNETEPEIAEQTEGTLVDCVTCKGSGLLDNATICSACNGSGKINEE